MTKQFQLRSKHNEKIHVYDVDLLRSKHDEKIHVYDLDLLRSKHDEKIHVYYVDLSFYTYTHAQSCMYNIDQILIHVLSKI